ncbi:MAG: hypothetical protein ACRETY_09305 [Steroidobacteraceae bacterium]
MKKSAVVLAVLAAPFLLAATVASGHLYGRYNDGVYQAPGKLFRMSSPFPDDPVVSDGKQPDNNNAGAVSFIDDAGRMNGVLYMEDKDQTIGKDGDATRHLADWFRDVGFPRFFQVNVPDSKVLRDEAGEIDGQPAWIAVAHVPKGSPLGLSVKGSYDVQRNDSWRGMAVVARGKHYYLLQTELRVEKLAAPDWSYDSDAANWNAFVPELEVLYQRIEFLKP